MAENEGAFPVQDGQLSWFTSTNLVDDAQQAFEDAADEILAYAQATAPWSDRTGDARSGLDVSVETAGNEVILTLFHTVEYGQWLETIQNGEFAIIMPTLELYAPIVFGRVGATVDETSGEDYSL